MSRNVQLHINLTPVSQYDQETSRFVIFYEEFPEAIASGIDENEAGDNLAFLVEDMWARRPEHLKDVLIKNYKHRIHIQTNRSADQKGVL